MRKKTEYEEYEDDNHTVANMNVPGIKGYKTPENEKRRKEISELNMTSKEKRAIWKAGLLLLLKSLGIVTLFFGIIYCVALLIM